MAEFYTYLQCKPDGTPFYVGKGHGRRSHSFKKADRNTHHNNIIAKYGKHNIQIFVFPCDSEDQAFSDEIQQIAQLRREGYILVNQTAGGDGFCGGRHSAERRATMNKDRMGVPRSAEVRAKISASNVGKKRSIETLQIMSRVQTGKKLSLECRAKMSAAHKGKKVSEETRAKMSKAQLARGEHERG